jgi:hypothetical protein
MYSSTGSASFFQLISVFKCRLTVAKKKGTAWNCRMEIRNNKKGDISLSVLE